VIQNRDSSSKRAFESVMLYRHNKKNLRIAKRKVLEISSLKFNT